MLEFDEIELTHANLDKMVNVRIGSIAFNHYSDKAECTYLYTIAGVVPVKESSEDITNKIKEKRSAYVTTGK